MLGHGALIEQVDTAHEMDGVCESWSSCHRCSDLKLVKEYESNVQSFCRLLTFERDRK